MPSAAPPTQAPHRPNSGHFASALIVALFVSTCAADDAIDPDDPKMAGHFAGRVVDADNRSIAGARIHIVPARPARGERPRPDPNGLGPVRAVSDADGRFAFDAPDLTFEARDGLPARRRGLLVATAEGFAPDALPTWGRSDVATVFGDFPEQIEPVPWTEPELHLARPDVPIRGRLLDAAGRPLVGAGVRLDSIEVPAGFNLTGYLRQALNNVTPKVEIRMSQPELLPGVERAATTDADGRFRLTGIGRDRIANLTVSARPGVDIKVRAMTLEVADVVLGRDDAGLVADGIMGADFTLRCADKPTATLSGVVRDRDTHRPIPGMVLDSWLWRLPASGPFVTDPDGRFRVEGVEAALLAQPPATQPARWVGDRFSLVAAGGPGVPYLAGWVAADRPDSLSIECARGIPFRLRVVDEVGAPIEATAQYYPVMPNPHLDGLMPGGLWRHRFADAARLGPGLAEGVALPGPGAILVSAVEPAGFRQAYVDPKAFFAPGRTDWTPQERHTAYGNPTVISGPDCGLHAWDYEAVVLINPPVESGPLELTATLHRDRPLTLHLVDPEGRPLVGADAGGLVGMSSVINSFIAPFRLRSATIPLRRLPLGANRRMVFLHEDRQLIGDLMARPDMNGPITLQLQPWASLSGRLLDDAGQPFPFDRMGFNRPSFMGRFEYEWYNDLRLGKVPYATTDAESRFRWDRLVPGRRYDADLWHGAKMDAGGAFDGIVLRPGERRDLGDVRTRKPAPAAGR